MRVRDHEVVNRYVSVHIVRPYNKKLIMMVMHTHNIYSLTFTCDLNWLIRD
jgi:hypothetical protein